MNAIVKTMSDRVMAYFAKNDQSQIPHTLNVAYFTRLIAANEEYNEEKKTLMEIAALLHDIGCPQAKSKYGNSLPVNQEKEGRIVAENILCNCNELTQEQKEWLCDVVGNHHHHNKVVELGFEALADADLIVNMIEGYYDKNRSSIFRKMIFTNKGREIFNELF